MCPKNSLIIGMILLAPAFMAGCSGLAEQPERKVSYDGVLIRNQALSGVHAVEIKTSSGEESVSCGTIQPQESCSKSVTTTTYEGTPFTLNWKYAGDSDRTIPLVIHEPADFDPADTHIAVIEFVTGSIFSVHWQARE